MGQPPVARKDHKLRLRYQKLVPEPDPFMDGRGELLERAEHAAVQAAALDFGEPRSTWLSQDEYAGVKSAARLVLSAIS